VLVSRVEDEVRPRPEQVGRQRALSAIAYNIGPRQSSNLIGLTVIRLVS
jgi:hypothetical protein